MHLVRINRRPVGKMPKPRCRIEWTCTKATVRSMPSRRRPTQQVGHTRTPNDEAAKSTWSIPTTTRPPVCCFVGHLRNKGNWNKPEKNSKPPEKCTWVEGEGGAQGGGAEEEEEGTGKGKGKGKEMKTPTRGNKKKKHSRRRRRQRKTIVREAISVKWCMGWIVLGRQMNVYFGINGCINTIDALIHVPIDMVTNPRKTSMQRTFVFIFVSRISTYMYILCFFFFSHIIITLCTRYVVEF